MPRKRRRRRKSRRSYNLRKRVMPSRGVAVQVGQRFIATPSGSGVTGVDSVKLTNLPFDADQDRKVVSARGRLDCGLTVGGGQAVEMIVSVILTPQSVGVPSVANYDPFVATPGEAVWKGKPFKTLFRKYIVRALPTAATGAVFDVPIRLARRAVRILHPGWDMYLVTWTRDNTTGTKNTVVAYDFGLTFLQ